MLLEKEKSPLLSCSPAILQLRQAKCNHASSKQYDGRVLGTQSSCASSEALNRGGRAWRGRRKRSVACAAVASGAATGEVLSAKDLADRCKLLTVCRMQDSAGSSHVVGAEHSRPAKDCQLQSMIGHGCSSRRNAYMLRSVAWPPQTLLKTELPVGM